MATVGRMVFLTFDVCTWEERALFVDFPVTRRSSTGAVSLSIRSHVTLVPCLRCGSFITSRSVAVAAASSARSDTRRILCWSQRASLILVVSAPSLCVFSAESRHCFVFRWLFAPGTARARSFCAHQRSQITESTVFKHIHHKDRRQLQLSTSRSRHIFSASLETPRAHGARQVRLACAKPQTSREVDQDPEGGLTRQCNTRTQFLDHVMCLGIIITRRRRWVPSQCPRGGRHQGRRQA